MPVNITGSAGAFFEQSPINCGGMDNNYMLYSTCYKYEQGNWLNVITPFSLFMFEYFMLTFVINKQDKDVTYKLSQIQLQSTIWGSLSFGSIITSLQDKGDSFSQERGF